MGAYLRVNSKSYRMNTKMKGFRWFSKTQCWGYFGSKYENAKKIQNHLNPRIALAETSQMSNHVSGFQSFFRRFCMILYLVNALLYTMLILHM